MRDRVEDVLYRTAPKEADMQQEFSKSEKFWMNFKLYQLWRFIVLNIKVYTVAVQSKWK